MLGAIIGDTIGSVYEFNPVKHTNFELFSDKSGCTDDSVLTVAVAKAILTGTSYEKNGCCRKILNHITVLVTDRQ